MKYYDITFHELSGKTIIKRNIPSEKEGFAAWEDACSKVTENELRYLCDDESEIYRSDRCGRSLRSNGKSTVQKR